MLFTVTVKFYVTCQMVDMARVLHGAIPFLSQSDIWLFLTQFTRVNTCMYRVIRKYYFALGFVVKPCMGL